MRHVLKCTWESGCQDELEQLFGFRAKRKTCNSEFISTIVDELLSKYKGS
ncbi:sporulation initiation factor Spo0A C-terminal domain-containing protein [[Ruminococcus] gnavus]|nr:sporulation initiation factor Spo0A C-terminal domain-containing protein [Mediterraneibacter gnavus]